MKKADNIGVAVNPPSYTEENKLFLKRMFNGEMKASLIVCHECKNVYLTEKGPSPEFASSYCPFCESPREASTVTFDVFKAKEKIAELSEKLQKSEETAVLADKIKRVILESGEQRFNVAACHECNNRFIYLEEDAENIMCCAFCARASQDMQPLLEYDVKQEFDTPVGLEKYIGHLFYLKLENGIEDNFTLTDIDFATVRMRFVSPTDDRMAFWITNDEIIDMMEFIRIDEK